MTDEEPAPQEVATLVSLDEGSLLALQAAVHWAALNGETAPRRVVLVLSERGAANSSLSGSVADLHDLDRPVCVTMLEGDFTARMAHGSHLDKVVPTAGVLTVVTDRESGDVTDWGLQGAMPSPLPPGAAHSIDPRLLASLEIELEARSRERRQ